MLPESVKLRRWPDSKKIGAENIVNHLEEALARARAILGLPPEGDPTQRGKVREGAGKQVA